NAAKLTTKLAQPTTTKRAKGCRRPKAGTRWAQPSARASAGPRRCGRRSADASVGRVVSRTRKRGLRRTSTTIRPTYSASTARNTNSTPNKNEVMATEDAQPGTTASSTHHPTIAYAVPRNANVEDSSPTAMPTRSGTSENELTPCQPSVIIFRKLYLLVPACRSPHSNGPLVVA